MNRQTSEKKLTQTESAKKCSETAVIPEDYQLNLSDFALFLSVMKVKEAYADVLSIIMDESELRLKEVKVEQVILNKSGKRAIRLDAWALDWANRQFNMEMQNDTSSDNVRKRSRFYQSMIDTPVLKAGKETRYKNLPSTVIIFITQDDIFGKDLAMYTFSERCEEVPDLPLEDGTTKIFVKDERILELDRIVSEVKQSEEWEAVRMNILEIGLQQGIERGIEQGIEQGIRQGMERGIQGIVETCQDFGISQDETLQKLMEKLSLSEEAAKEQLIKYWR